MSNKPIYVALAVLVVLLVAYLLSKGPWVSTKPKVDASAFETLRNLDPDKVAKITLRKGEGEPVVLERRDGSWVVASAYGYPANDEKIKKIIEELKNVSEPEVAGETSQSHEDFKVDEKNGALLTLEDKDGNVLAKVIVGDTARSANFRVTKVYLRFPDEERTYRVVSDIRSEASLWGEKLERRNYLKTQLVKLEDDEEVFEARIVRPGKPDLIVERRTREVPVESEEGTKTGSAGESSEAAGSVAAAPAEAGGEGASDTSKEGAGEEKKEEEKPKTKKEEYFVVTSGAETHEVPKDKAWVARSLLDKGRSIYIEDAAEPKPLGEYGLEQPQLKAIFAYRKKDKPESRVRKITLRFGNAVKSEEGTTKAYYVTLEGVEGLEGKIYTMASYNFDSLNKELKDFLPEPKKEEKKKEKAGEESKTEPKAESKPDAPSPAKAEEASAAEKPSQGQSAGETPKAGAEAPEGAVETQKAAETPKAEGAAGEGAGGTSPEKEAPQTGSQAKAGAGAAGKTGANGGTTEK